jgi:hypothetical protein
MNILQCLDGFQFHNDFVANDQVELVETNVLFLKEDENFLLFLKRQSSMPQSDLHGLLIYALEKARPQSLVDRTAASKIFPDKASNSCPMFAPPFFFVFSSFVLS